jgi:hypothetical protein
MGRQEEPTSSRPYAFVCDERKGKRRLPLQVPQVKKRKNKKVMMMKKSTINIILRGRRNNPTRRKGNGDDPQD